MKVPVSEDTQGSQMQFLKQHGYTEMKFAGVGQVADTGIEFNNELFYADTVIASVACAGFSKVSFDIYL